MKTFRHCTTYLFLSTLSLRRATVDEVLTNEEQTDFYPRSPCGERHSARPGTHQRDVISIHALLAESDLILHMAHLTEHLFLSTLSLRRATREPTALRTPHHKFLSTLSLRRATEPATSGNDKNNVFLSTLSLRRATINKIPYQRQINQFLSTLSLRRATTKF